MALALLFLAASSGRLVSGAAPDSHTNSLSLGYGSVRTAESTSLFGRSVGSLPGEFTSLISFDATGGSITGGTWSLKVTRTDLGGNVEEVGALSGKIVSGELSLDGEGRVSSVSAAQLEITSGTGAYADVVAGRGSLTVKDGGQSPQPLDGSLVLTF